MAGTSRDEHDAAFGVYLGVGAAVLVIALLGSLPLDTGSAGALGILVAVPLGAAALLGSLLGIGMSLRLRSDRALVALAVLAAGFLVQFVAEWGPVWLLRLVPVTYGAACVTLGLDWFLRRRVRSV